MPQGRPNIVPDAGHAGSRSYECRIALLPEDVGGYSVFALDLPGVASQGESEEEAIANIRDALEGAFEVYLEDQGEIPWSFETNRELPTNVTELRIVVECPSSPS